MLPNIDANLYAKFKLEGYRIKAYSEEPVTTTSEIVQLAYLDVCRTVEGITSQQSQSLKQAVIAFLETLLASPPTNQAQFDELHHRCCQTCLACGSSNGAHINYGHAQKLVNMSLKYLYNEFAVYYEKLNTFEFPNTNLEHLFHLPIDSPIRNHLVGNHNFTDPTTLPWSQWSYDHYMAFQEQLRYRISSGYQPLAIDYLIWNSNGASVGDAIRSTPA